MAAASRVRSVPAGRLIVVAYAMLVLYLAPPSLLAAELLRTAAESTTPVLRFYFALSSDPGPITEIHQVLAPLAAILSVVAARRANVGAVWGLLGLAIAGLLLTGILQVSLNMEDMQRDLAGLDLESRAGRDLLQLQRSNLLQYVAVLSGLKLLGPEDYGKAQGGDHEQGN